MSYRLRINFTAEQKNEIWDRWQRCESMSSIGRGFDPGVVADESVNAHDQERMWRQQRSRSVEGETALYSDVVVERP